ncbi:MAG: alpha-ribazole phosphatase family protein [Mangrovibacterium sp.]
MQLTCIRHTRVAVPSGICYGQTDVPLAGSYAEELETVKKRVKSFRFDRIFCSPLSRCRKLADDLFPGLEIRFDDRLKELHFGDWENKGWEEIFFSAAGRHWMEHYLEAACPGGESYLLFRSRILSFLSELRQTGLEKIVLVTHNGVIRLLKSILEKMTVEEVFEQFNPAYGGVYSFALE